MTAPSSLSFYKVSGGGNDFIALPETGEKVPAPSPEQIRTWCRRGLSLGADGLFVLRRIAAGRVLMEHSNADGSAAELCLNGTRCAARLAFELGWAQGEVEIQTGAGSVRATDAGDRGIRLELPPPDSLLHSVSAEVDGKSHSGWLLRIGVPHFVLECPEGLAESPVEALGSRLVHHPAMGAAGANIDFIHLVSPQRVEIRTYERGVNAETLACGTGVMATAAVLLSQGRASLPLTALTRGGFELTVDGDLDQAEIQPRIKRWSLTGDARLVARGEILPGASTPLAEPVWTPSRVVS